jgi:hypothetical protein
MFTMNIIHQLEVHRTDQLMKMIRRICINTFRTDTNQSLKSKFHHVWQKIDKRFNALGKLW